MAKQTASGGMEAENGMARSALDGLIPRQVSDCGLRQSNRLPSASYMQPTHLIDVWPLGRFYNEELVYECCEGVRGTRRMVIAATADRHGYGCALGLERRMTVADSVEGASEGLCVRSV